MYELKPYPNHRNHKSILDLTTADKHTVAITQNMYI